MPCTVLGIEVITVNKELKLPKHPPFNGVYIPVNAASIAFCLLDPKASLVQVPLSCEILQELGSSGTCHLDRASRAFGLWSPFSTAATWQWKGSSVLVLPSHYPGVWFPLWRERINLQLSMPVSERPLFCQRLPICPLIPSQNNGDITLF